MTIINKTCSPKKEKKKKERRGESLANQNDAIAASSSTYDYSTFSKVLAIYSRSIVDHDLFHIEEKENYTFKKNWKQFQSLLAENRIGNSLQTDKVQEYVVQESVVNECTMNSVSMIKVSEYKKKDEVQIRGVITSMDNENEFNDWFIFHILDQCRIRYNEFPLISNAIPYHEIFADYFAANLKNTIVEDEWDSKGRSYFINRVKYFTDRYIRIECVLPAFPCKSSNNEKVYGALPDKGEELALRRLIKATFDVKKFYPPGMKVWIVSDGHVFSDCIGVDDDVVSHYTDKLHDMYESLSIPGIDAIGFCGLNGIFFTGEATKSFDPTWVSDVKMKHYTGTKICSVSEMSRQILMKGCDTDAGKLRQQICTDKHPKLHLYRGFSRFMMEDLSLLPFFKDSSRKGFKKIISKIAFNMIKRNDAYSNLVELMFPHHLRISIHAHTNSGPKFGIKVISERQCKIIRNLNDLVEPKYEDLLHIPTPWHNTVVKVIKHFDEWEDADDDENIRLNNGYYFLTKLQVIKEAIDSGKFFGTWRETRLERGQGGYYLLCEK